MANAWTRGAGAGVMNAPPYSVVFAPAANRCRSLLLAPGQLFGQASRSEPPLPTRGRTRRAQNKLEQRTSLWKSALDASKTPDRSSASRGPGNGILRAETGERFRPQNVGERPEFGSQTATCPSNRRESRGFLSTRKPRRFAGTAWWSQTESNRWPSDAAARPIRIGGVLRSNWSVWPRCISTARNKGFDIRKIYGHFILRGR